MKRTFSIVAGLLLITIPNISTAKGSAREEKPTCVPTNESCLMNLAGKSGAIIRVTEPDGSVTFYAGFKNVTRKSSPNTPASKNEAPADAEEQNAEKTAYALSIKFLGLWGTTRRADELSEEVLKDADATAQAYFNFIWNHPSVAEDIFVFAGKGNRYWKEIQIQTVWDRISPENRFWALNRYIGDFKDQSGDIRSEDLATTEDIYSAILKLTEIFPDVEFAKEGIYRSARTVIRDLAPDIHKTLFNKENLEE